MTKQRWAGSSIIYNFIPELIKRVGDCGLFVTRSGSGDTHTEDPALTADSEPGHQSEHVAVLPR